MNSIIKEIKEYANLLSKASKWATTSEVIAPVITDGTNVADNYIYEFYCYIRIIADLRKSYTIEFIEGEDKFQFKFPQAPAHKKGKPRFHALKKGKLAFQVCAGTKIKGKYDYENNHPDISFQVPSASDDPVSSDLILIMDAKFTEGKEKKIARGEVYKFGMIIKLFELKSPKAESIIFDKFNKMHGHCLITNGRAYSDPAKIDFLQDYAMKEVELFTPSAIFHVVG